MQNIVKKGSQWNMLFIIDSKRNCLIKTTNKNGSHTHTTMKHVKKKHLKFNKINNHLKNSNKPPSNTIYTYIHTYKNYISIQNTG